MRKGQPKYPTPRDVGPVIRALKQHIPMDFTPLCFMRESLKHVPNFRMKAQTHEVEWCVDIYRGHFYHVMLLDTTEIFRTIPSLVTYLWRMLDIKKS